MSLPAAAPAAEAAPTTYLNIQSPFLRLQTKLTYSSSSMKRQAADHQLCSRLNASIDAGRAERLWNMVKPVPRPSAAPR